MSVRHVLGCAGLACLTLACDMVPRAPVDLRNARVVSVQVGARAGDQAICPGEPVPLDLDVTALLPGRAEPTALHVRREELDDWLVDTRALHMSSRQGKVDELGVFHPNADARSSADSGFLLDLHLPGGPAFGVRFRPRYECVHVVGVSARSGQEGAPGEPGLSGYAVDAEPGGAGGEGGPGEPGSTEAVYVTFVKTPFFPRLLAALAEGDADDSVLAPANRSLLVNARGGAGGAGGVGGEGGHAFSTIDLKVAPRSSRGRHRSTGAPPAPAQHPGAGGLGGPGGPGGAGGNLTVHIDGRFPEIVQLLELDVRGGPGGRGGAPGKGGDVSPVPGYGDNGDRHGRPGGYGATGPEGAHGTKRIVMEKTVRDRFVGLGGIEVL